MTIQLEEKDGDILVAVSLPGKLAEADCEILLPVVERSVKAQGKIRRLVAMHGFHGWNAGALWKDPKFAARHFVGIERWALVRESKWQEGMAPFCRPFAQAAVRYLDQTAVGGAPAWTESS